MWLSAGNLSFSYARSGREHERRVIDDVSLVLRPGEVVGILGPNGSGKTTLLRLMSGSLAPDSGEVTLDERPLRSLPRRDVARRIAVVPQETSLAFDYTVLEIVLMGRYPHLGAFEIEGPEDLAIAMRSLDATGTAEFAERPFRTLSGGEKQRVVIASALAQLESRKADTSGAGGLLVLDEPTASLDLHYQFEIGSLVTRLHEARGITILLSTHDLRFAATVCTKLVLLSGGRVLAEGAPADVLTPERVGALFDVDPSLTIPLLAAAGR